MVVSKPSPSPRPFFQPPPKSFLRKLSNGAFYTTSVGLALFTIVGITVISASMVDMSLQASKKRQELKAKQNVSEPAPTNV